MRWLPLLLASCTQAGLQPVTAEVEQVDDRLAVSGAFCPSEPDQVVFPVKVLLVVDQSASLQCTDPANARIAALDEAGRALDGLPNVSFAVVGFASWSRPTAFSTSWDEAAEALLPANGSGGPATDYQGSLAVARDVLETELLRAGPAENARSRIVVLFLSDGVPEPRCTAGCDDGDRLPDSLYGVCNTEETIPEDEYVEMLSACPSYNSQSQILDKVRDLSSVAESYGVGAFSMNTLLLFAPPEEIEAACGDVSAFGYIREEAEPLLAAMAAEGEGTYRDVNTAAAIDQLDFGYQTLEAPYQLVDLFAVNQSAMPTGQGHTADTDGDGLTDSREFELGLDKLSTDSDADGYGDALELRGLDVGFDPADPARPVWGCADTTDRDGDGLRACEEDYLGTDPLEVDSDGDRLPDGFELRMGLDPAVNDVQGDPDRDGRLTGAEVLAGTHPAVLDSETAVLASSQVSVDLDSESGCYDWSVSDLHQVVTAGPVSGQNRTLIYATEEPFGVGGARGRTWVACVTSRYLGPEFKAPASGEAPPLTAENFVELPLFDPAVHCVEAE